MGRGEKEQCKELKLKRGRSRGHRNTSKQRGASGDSGSRKQEQRQKSSAEVMGRERNREKIRYTGREEDGGWFSASGGSDRIESTCRPGECKGQTRMDRDSFTEDVPELPMSSLGVFLPRFPHGCIVRP